MIGRLVAEAVLDDWAIQGLIHSDQPSPHATTWRLDQNRSKLIFPATKRQGQPEKVGVDKICKPLIRSLSKCSDMGDVQCSREQLSIFYLNS